MASNLRRTASLTSLHTQYSNAYSLINLPPTEYEILSESSGDEEIIGTEIIFRANGENIKLEIPKKIKTIKPHHYKRKPKHKKQHRHNKFPFGAHDHHHKHTKSKGQLLIEKTKKVVNAPCKLVWKELSWSYIKNAWNNFWSKFYQRIWNLHIESLLIPAYRQEWGQFSEW